MLRGSSSSRVIEPSGTGWGWVARKRRMRSARGAAWVWDARPPYSGSPRILVGTTRARLALYGRFEQVPVVLFLARGHSEQSMAMIGNWAD